MYHAIFPPNNKFHVAFREAALRDQFDQQLTKLEHSGEYKRLVDHYHAGPVDANAKK